jgi:hypothetical protein
MFENRKWFVLIFEKKLKIKEIADRYPLISNGVFIYHPDPMISSGEVFVLEEQNKSKFYFFNNKIMLFIY